MCEGDFKLLEDYKRDYHRLTFEEKKRRMKEIVGVFPQQLHASNETWVAACLEEIASSRRDLNILELGTYSGELALRALERFPGFSWTGYDIVRVEPINELREFRFTLNELDEEFYLADLDDDFDVFITTDTLEHFTWREVLEIFQRTSRIEYQIHVVDFARGDRSAHLLEVSPSRFLTAFKDYFRCLRHVIFIDSRMRGFGPYLGGIPVSVHEFLRRVPPLLRQKVLTNRMGLLGRARSGSA